MIVGKVSSGFWITHSCRQTHDQLCCSLVHPERSGLHGVRGRPSAGVPAGGTGRGRAFSAPEGPGHFLRGHSAVLQEDPQEDAWDGRSWNTSRAHLPASGTKIHTSLLKHFQHLGVAGFTRSSSWLCVVGGWDVIGLQEAADACGGRPAGSGGRRRSDDRAAAGAGGTDGSETGRRDVYSSGAGTRHRTHHLTLVAPLRRFQWQSVCVHRSTALTVWTRTSVCVSPAVPSSPPWTRWPPPCRRESTTPRDLSVRYTHTHTYTLSRTVMIRQDLISSAVCLSV